ncbi:MAG: glutaredoxin [Tissierellia bacterium]|nr:glutaredoxin [Tissierellia bacterium]
MKLQLYYKDTCPYSQKVLRFLDKHEIGEEQVERKDILEDLSIGDELEEKGGKRQVPCLFVDDEPMYESSDIIAFLKEKLL